MELADLDGNFRAVDNIYDPISQKHISGDIHQVKNQRFYNKFAFSEYDLEHLHDKTLQEKKAREVQDKNKKTLLHEAQ